jgi:hypothetical protein
MMKLFRSDTTVQEKQEPPGPEMPAQDMQARDSLAEDAPLQPAQDGSERTPHEEAAPAHATAEASNAEAARATGGEAFETELEDVIRRDVVRWHRPQPQHASPAGDNVSSLVQRVSGQSVREIDHVIGELLIVRDFLREEGERLRRDLTGYASLNQAAMSSVKAIGDSMENWRSTLGKVRRA